MRILRSFVAWLPAVFAALLLLTVLPAQWKHYRTVCPSTDVLTWDGNLRLTAVADQYRDFQNGKIGRAVLSVLDAPTWPAFRGIVSLSVFSLTGGPAVRREVAISFFYYCALFASLLFAGMRLSGSIFVGGLITLAASLLLIHARDFGMFALSAMLETQGMFFMLWTVYFIHRLYETQQTRERSPENEKWLIAGLCLSTQGVFHTKYPYGVVLLIALVGAEVIRRPRFYMDFARRLHKEHFRSVRLALVGVFLAALILSARWGLLGDASPAPRLAKRLVYLGFLIFVVDFNIHVYRRRRELNAHLPPPMKLLYLWGVVPALIWLFMHPTRFNTTLGTQQRLPPGTDELSFSYFRLFFQQFDQNWILIGFMTAAALALVVVVYRAYRSRSETKTSSGGTFATDAMLMATMAIALQWLLMEFSTPNKQPRHVYHLVPALFLLAGLWISHLTKTMELEWGPRSASVMGLACVLLVGAGGYSLVIREPGLLSGDYFNGRNVCANLPHRFYEPARWHAAALHPHRRHIVINTYHESGPPGRLLASHIDLLARMRVKGKGDVRNDSRHRWKSWRNFERLQVLAENCKHPLVLARTKKRVLATKSRVRLLREKRHPNGKFCFREYQIGGAELKPRRAP